MFCQIRFFRTFSVSANLHVKLAAKFTFTFYQVTCCQDKTVSIFQFDLGFSRSNTSVCERHVHTDNKQLVLHDYFSAPKIGQVKCLGWKCSFLHTLYLGFFADSELMFND